MICIAVTYQLRPGTVEDALDLFAKLTERTREEPGCRMYLVHRSETDPLRFFLYEQYDNHEALQAHRSAPYFAEYAADGLFHLIESRHPEIYVPIEP